ncbi:MAG: hypothetical protein EXS16_06390 [Gemmataceae bacterium]|nr:hypothetical protein [Gemmataceae bacterium]
MTFGVNQSIVDVILTPQATFYTNGLARFYVQLDTPAAAAGYIIPAHNVPFFIPSMTMTAYDNSTVDIYDGTCLFASTNDITGLAEVGDSVNIYDIQQGKIGDCAFLAAVGAMVNQNPALIRNLIQYNGNGTATVNFFPTVGAAAVPITVNLTLDAGYSQAKLAGDYRMSAGASPHREWEIWPQVLEKAYALFRAQQGSNVNNVYANLGDQWAYEVWQYLANQAAQEVTTAGLTAASIAAQINLHFTNGSKIVVPSETDAIVTVDDGLFGPLNYKIVGSHAYTLLRIGQDVDGNDIMELFNPHGGDPAEPDGGWPNPISSPVIEVPLAAFNTYFRRFQSQ